MNDLFYPFRLLVSRMFLPRYGARLQILIAQIRILRAKIDADRIVPTPEEKAELLRLGALMDHHVQDVMHIVTPTRDDSDSTLSLIRLSQLFSTWTLKVF